jgi:myo-inositol-1(or 4)-monophosphatase
VGRTWVIDPLDGTINYANGIPYFCVAIGLVVDGVPTVGVVHDPMRSETFSAAVGGPARLGDIVVTASDKAALGDCVISLALGGRAVATRGRAIRKAIRVSRNMGSAALALGTVVWASAMWLVCWRRTALPGSSHSTAFCAPGRRSLT